MVAEISTNGSPWKSSVRTSRYANASVPKATSNYSYIGVGIAVSAGSASHECKGTRALHSTNGNRDSRDTSLSRHPRRIRRTDHRFCSASEGVRVCGD